MILVPAVAMNTLNVYSSHNSKYFLDGNSCSSQMQANSQFFRFPHICTFLKCLILFPERSQEQFRSHCVTLEGLVFKT